MATGGGGGVRTLATVVGVALTGVFTLSLTSSATIRTLRSISLANSKKVALPCGVCTGKGFYKCKLCNGKSTIEWSPLFDPVVINPCLCPTCDGNSVQRCLNCLGKGYY